MATTDVVPGVVSVVRPLLVRHENERLHVYKDSLGIPTAGVGLALTEPDGVTPSAYAQQLCQRCGVDFEALLSGAVDLTPAQSDQILNLCIIDCVEDLSALFPQWASIAVNRQAGLVDMRFNLGPSRFREFHQMIAAVNADNWPEAVTQALNSKWAEEVPERAHEDVALLLNG